MLVSWCNGSTAVFGSACQSSNLCETTHNSKTVEVHSNFNRFFQTTVAVFEIIL